MSERELFDQLCDDIDGSAAHGIHSNAQRMAAALAAVGDPQADIKIVQVLGTNGKGSTASFIDSIIRASGRSCALYTSPHLVSMQERLKIDGRCIGYTVWRSASERLNEALKSSSCDHLSFFEYLTVLALMLARDAGVSHGVFEAGVGGRQDATTALPKIGAVFAPIGLDHTKYLGTTLPEIAREKFAAVRGGLPAFYAAYAADDESLPGLFADACCEAGASAHILTEADRPRDVRCDTAGTTFSLPGMEDLHTHLIGPHQADNAAIAALAARVCIGASDCEIRSGIATAEWQGRFEIRHTSHGIVALDGAHNPHGIDSLLRTLEALAKSGASLGGILFGAMKDKDVSSSLKALAALGVPMWCTRPIYRRGMQSAELASLAREAGIKVAGAYEDPTEALRSALSAVVEDKLVVCCGSLYLVGDLMSYLDRM